MALSGNSLNFKTSPSGLIIPSAAANTTLNAVDVTHELAGPGDGTKFLSGTDPPTWAVPAGGGSPTGAAGGVLDGSYPNPGLAASVAGAGLTETSDVLAVNTDGSTLEISSDTLRVKADGITANEVAANAIGPSELASTAVTPGSYGDSTHVAAFTVDADGRLTAASNVAVTGGGGGGATATDTKAWLPLTTTDSSGDDVLVFDDDHSLIPTLVPF